jgi:hypothetical protein
MFMAIKKDERLAKTNTYSLLPPSQPHRQMLEAELSGNDECRCGGITTRSSSPVLAMCRALVGAGYDPNRPLHVYRDKVLALTVRSIGEGARLTVSGNGTGFRWIQAQGLPLVESPSLDAPEANERMGEAAAHQSEGD